MSVSYYAKTVLGMEFNKNKLYKNELVRTCSCSVDGTPNYCPKCGRAFQKWEKVPVIPNFEPDGEIGSFEVTGTTDRHRLFIGKVVQFRIGEGDDEAAKIDGDLNQIKSDLQALLEPYGLWDEKAFGTWCVGYCSY